MHIPWRLLSIILSILLHVQKIFGGELDAIRDEYDGPLVLIKEGNPLKLKLAIPRKEPKSNRVARYSYDHKSEHEPIQEFKTACPAHTDEQKSIENNWKKSANVSTQSKLFFLQEYTDENMLCWTFHEVPGPSIRKTNRDCGKSEGEIYKVGYPILNEEKNVQFMAIYEICHSKVTKKGIIYTKHRIDSPSLLLLKVHEDYEPEVLKSFTSPLDAKLTKVKKLYESEYIYQFVPTYDMPTVLWENTTLFPFNYTSVGPYTAVFRNMMKYDNVIRLFSKKMKKPLTIYSGKIRKVMSGMHTAWYGRRSSITVPLHSFWRVIMDDDNKAIILITQYTIQPCNGNGTFICYDDLFQLETYEGGGCTYTCSVSAELLDLLNLPKWNIKGKLDIRYDRTVEPKSELTPLNTDGKPDADAQSSSKEVDISDFKGGEAFIATLRTVDPGEIAIMQAEGAIEPSSKNGNSDGTTDAVGYNGGGGADSKVVEGG